jgi:hypothetical protein
MAEYSERKEKFYHKRWYESGKEIDAEALVFSIVILQSVFKPKKKSNKQPPVF